MSGQSLERPALISVADINARLVADIRSVVPLLLPAGHQRGGEWTEASTKRGGLGDSLSVCMDGARAGIWCHFATGAAGDLVDLIAYVRTGGDKPAAVRWAKDFLGHGVAADGAGAAAALARARASAKARERQHRAESERKRAWAQAMWLDAPKVKPGDVVDRYLSSRGIGLLQLGRAPGCLRAGHSLRHASGGEWPAMLAAVIGPDGEHMATHRTYLTPAGTKADVEPVKSVLGLFLGGHVPVWKGEHRASLRTLPEGVPVYISEGIEDGLSAALLTPAARVIAAVSLGNMAKVALPPHVREVVLLGQNDPETLPDGRPHPAVVAMQTAIDAHAKAGRLVRVARPPAGIKDFNDWIRLGSAA